MNERTTYEFYLNKRVLLFKKVNNFRYSGVVIELTDTKLILDDNKVGRKVLSYDEIADIEEIKE